MTYSSVSQHTVEGQQGRNRKAGPEAEARTLASLLSTAYSACLLMQPRATRPEMTLPTMMGDLGRPSLTKKNASQPSNEALFSMEVLLPR